MEKKIPFRELPIEALEEKLLSPNGTTRAAARNACRERKDIPTKVIRKWAHENKNDLKRGAMCACLAANSVPWDAVETVLKTRGMLEEAKAVCKRRYPPIEIIERWARDEDQILRRAAIISKWLPNEIPWDVLKLGLEDKVSSIHYTADERIDEMCECGIIPLKVIQDWAADSNANIRKKAAKACIYNTSVPVSILEHLLYDENWRVVDDATSACEKRADFPMEAIVKAAHSGDWYIRRAAMMICRTRKNVPVEIIDSGLRDDNSDVREETRSILSYGLNTIPLINILQWAKDSNTDVRHGAMNACNSRKDIPAEVIELGLRDEKFEVQQAAIFACCGRDDIPEPTIMRWIRSSEDSFREAAMTVCRACDTPLWDAVILGLEDDAYFQTQQEAIKICESHKDIPIDVIAKGIKSQSYAVRYTMMQSCEGRTDVPWSIIEAGMNDGYDIVREYAWRACESRSDRESLPWSLIKAALLDGSDLVRELAVKYLDRVVEAYNTNKTTN